MSVFPRQTYAAWRARALELPACCEPRDDAPSERFLQTLWQHQRLQRDRLFALDGRPVRVLHPGFWNHEPGPDFREALIQFANDFPRTGDVEIDVAPSAWRAHGHDRNPAYRRVILHVVWEAATSAVSALPTLALKVHLDSPLDELRHWLGVDAALPAWLAGRCRQSLQQWADADLTELLRQAAEIRLQRKGQELAARAREAGWEQALYEALFAALGYKHNVWPLRRLAELLPRLRTPEEGIDAFALQTRLLGVSGLLPVELTHRWPSVDRYLRQAWDRWWREKDRFAEIGFPPAIWHLHGFRPANHPQRRLALACQWLAAGDLPSRLQDWLRADVPDRRLSTSLLEILQGQADPFWSWHWNLRTARLPQPQPLLGPPRATDLAVNVVLPWFWIRAVTGQNEPVRALAERRYFAWRAAEDNAILRLARQRLLGGDRHALFRVAAAQQGLLQIERDFCEQSNALCERCPFPELVARAVRPAHES